MIILQLDSDQLANMIKSSVRSVLAEQSLDSQLTQERFLTLKEAALLLNRSPQTLYGFTSNRAIPFYKNGKKLYFKKSELEKWLSDGRRKTVNELGSDFDNTEKGGKHG